MYNCKAIRRVCFFVNHPVLAKRLMWGFIFKNTELNNLQKKAAVEDC